MHGAVCELRLARELFARYHFDPEAVAQSLAVVPAPNVAFFAFAGVSLVFTTQLKHPFCNLLCIKLGGQNAMITPIKLLSIATQHTCTPLPRNLTVSEMICESISCCVDPEICAQLDLLVAP
jgi:hypothetical protein